MNLTNHPELLDQLAASYALGSLRGGARRRFETLARQHVTVRAQALIWQDRLASLTELQASEAPSPNVWKRIANLVESQKQTAAQLASQAVQAPTATPGKPGRAMQFWRGAAVVGALGTLAAVAVGIKLSRQVDSQTSQLAAAAQQSVVLARQNDDLLAKLGAVPDIQYVAMLADASGEQPAASVLVTFDPKNKTLVLKRLGGYEEVADKSLQLWALPKVGGPQSLGVLATDKLVRLVVASEDDVRAAPALAISLEPKGGVPGKGGPTGPVLFTGALHATF